jgi:hypothetical protein
MVSRISSAVLAHTRPQVLVPVIDLKATRGSHTRVAGLPDLADEALRVLPDPVEYDYAARFLAQHGITKDELISRRGGSP